MSEQLTWHSPDDLRSLPTEALEALWELVPTERQKAYKTAYESEVTAAGAAGSDALERQVAQELLRRYRETGLVPLGSRWARAPGRVQAAAQADEPLVDEVAPRTGKVSRGLLLAGAVLLLVFIGLIAMRLGGRPAIVAMAPTASPTASPTPRQTLTPTPLALEEQDTIIEGGDPDRATAYPVRLEIDLGAGATGRVWVVQRRLVRAAEWRFDPNPDTASYLSGLSIRPVIGLPWSPENAAFFRQIGEGALFTLTLNTGAIRQFRFVRQERIHRRETEALRQTEPGLTLLLIGETDDEGLPTASRPLVLARYEPEQELSRDFALVDDLLLPLTNEPQVTMTPLPTPLPDPYAELEVHMIAASRTRDTLTTQLWLYNGGLSAIPIRPKSIWLALGYAPEPDGPRMIAEGLAPFDLLPGQAADVTLVWVWNGEPFASFSLGGFRYRLALSVD
ncbi:MAG: hypothetical protein J0M33_11680 [Anaerolineae bacterium]|nr:hypothetical protein [Anaerolineae bacterium]